MRQITQEAVRAFYNWESYNKSNTRVDVDNEIVSMYLHWNLIAERNNWMLYISSANWETNTTKERLNGLLKRFNLRVKQKNYKWYLEDLHTGDLINWVEWERRNGVEIF